MNPKSALIAIVTGMEHSATTYLADLIKTHPHVGGGFECGVLLGKTPADFPDLEPFYEWMQKRAKPDHWGVLPEQMQDIVRARDWQEMYERIRNYSPLFSGPKRYLLDKTPRYMPDLPRIMQAVPAPVIVVFKDTDYQYLSYKRRNYSMQDFFAHYQHYFNGLFLAYKPFNRRLMLLSHRTICEKPRAVLSRVYNFLGLKVPDRFLPLDKIFLTPGPVRSDFNRNREREGLVDLSAEERQLINRFKVDETLYKIAEKF